VLVFLKLLLKFENMTSAKIQKFGLQTSTPPTIILWKNGDKFDKGTPFLLKNMKTIDQLQKHLAEKLQMLPAVKLYTVDGHLMRSLEDFENRGNYVVVKQATVFNPDTVPPACPRDAAVADVA